MISTAPEQAVTAWLALDPADEDNGCLRYVRGSAAGGVRAHRYSGVIGFSQTLDAAADAADAQNEFALPAAPGDLLLHTATMVQPMYGGAARLAGAATLPSGGKV
ncbi:hypothetical protein EMIHUDRAFT_212858 [Emiliania huxleyi CCMP1516]|uniref:Uncharacterized protein n=2 Tax=Emiliania huxleyi TaxID=2903 RepID=A0A0D3IPE4_EMIH1|nr:hypothetical protein EMIHUDRAFT_212858 [Emiliania huxleyi CCMP1516]EOD13129.1 hypothetical protein EMIHUDRAFT_212858 [Emiliania huxleyi CCMP1516]|eukprot:XP_005765558.1 hypothetical protein EMIHUDRAFT_212858 [Emiliania huxleyi CCMP1516]